MHTQHTLHLTDKQYNRVVELLTCVSMEVSDTDLVGIMTSEGIRQYPAEKMVEQRARFYHKFPIAKVHDADHDPVFEHWSFLAMNHTLLNISSSENA